MAAVPAAAGWKRPLAFHLESKAMLRFTCACMASLLFLSTAWSCDYTVRDIGFIRLRDYDYTVVCVGPHEVSPEVDAELLQDWNVHIANWSPDSSEQLPEAMKKKWNEQGDRSSIWLVDSLGRSLLVWQSSNPKQAPQLEQAVKRLSTKTNTEIRDAALHSFAQLVLFEGAQDNESAQQVVDKASEAIRRIEHLLPRPISEPISVITVPWERRREESTLLWVMGNEALQTQEPVLSVVYGVGRMAGPAMIGKAITVDEVLSQLALVGESCECETTRQWADETILPLCWPPKLRNDAQHFLSFDPESPLVKAEVKRTLAKGRRPNDSPPTGEEDVVDLILRSYHETDLAGSPQPRRSSDPTSRGDSVQATVLAGSGWDFEEEPSGTDDRLAPSIPPGSDRSPSKAALETPAPPGDRQLGETLVETEEVSPVTLMLFSLTSMSLLVLVGTAIYWRMSRR